MRFAHIAMLAVVAGSGTAHAGFTVIAAGGAGNASTEGSLPNVPSLGINGSSQRNIKNILRLTYGTTFSLWNNGRTDGTNQVDLRGTRVSDNATLIARRVQDYVGTLRTNVGNNLTLNQGTVWNNLTVADQVWKDSVVESTANARFAGDTQYLATVTNANNSTDLRLGISGSNGFFPDGNAAVTYFGSNPRIVPESPFRWQRSSNQSLTLNNTFSRADDNSGDMDTQVTYQIFRLVNNIEVPLYGIGTYMMFFEDRPTGDRDFNDLAVELIVHPQSPIVLVPLPSAALAGMGTLSWFMLSTQSRRRRSPLF